MLIRNYGYAANIEIILTCINKLLSTNARYIIIAKAPARTSSKVLENANVQATPDLGSGFRPSPPKLELPPAASALSSSQLEIVCYLVEKALVESLYTSDRPFGFDPTLTVVTGSRVSRKVLARYN